MRGTAPNNNGICILNRVIAKLGAKSAKRALLAASCIALALSFMPHWTHAQSAAPGVEDFLHATIGNGTSQLADARNGSAAVALLHTAINRDVAVFGIIGIHTTRDAYLARIRDMQPLIASRGEPFGMVGDPIKPDEMQHVFFEGSEWHDLQSCDVNDCAFKMPVSLMHEFDQQVDWDGQNAREQVDSIMRAAMVDLVAAYRARGNSAMLRYDDTNGTLAGDAFDALLGQSQFLRNYAPAFHDFLASYPASRPDGVQDAMYWSMYKASHLRSTFTVNQLLVYTPPSGTPLIARKQIYADHYFESELELSAVFDAPDLAGGPGIYLVTVQRYRFDNLPGGIFNIRGRVRSQLQTTMKSDLERERAAAEAKPAG